ncbi:atherin-like [Numida meleagris]|uniref:atherin-like n=1 Tax=Numida meleagris TaxID=8996 RepID=UPI000B3DD9CD|nr:atherin-like [Numida meleagris]
MGPRTNSDIPRIPARRAARPPRPAWLPPPPPRSGPDPWLRIPPPAPPGPRHPRASFSLFIFFVFASHEPRPGPCRAVLEARGPGPVARGGPGNAPPPSPPLAPGRGAPGGVGARRCRPPARAARGPAVRRAFCATKKDALYE